VAAVKRAVDEQGQPVTSLSGDPADGDAEDDVTALSHCRGDVTAMTSPHDARAAMTSRG